MNKIKSALKWSFLGEVLNRLIQPLSFVIIMTMLQPADYGVAAAAAMVIAFTQIFWEGGLGKALIQYQGNKREAASTAFIINLGLGAFVASLVWFGSELVALKIFNDPRVVPVLKLLTIQIVITSFTTTQVALLQDQFNFRGIFLSKVAQSTIPALVSLGAAFQGHGYWSLVWGTLAGTIAHSIIIWTISDWRPSFIWSNAHALKLGKFGAWVSVSSLLTWFYLWADSLFISVHLSSTELGNYRTGSQATGMIFSLILSPILPVLYSSLTKVDGSRELIGKRSMDVMSGLALISLPLAAIVFCIAGPAAELFLPSHWIGIGSVISIVGLMQGISTVVGANGEAYRAIGKPQIETIVNASMLMVYLPAYYLSVRIGFESFLWTRLGLATIAFIVHISLFSRVFSIGVRSFDSIVITAIVSLTFGLLLQLVANFLGNGLIAFGATTFVAAMVIGASLVYLSRNKSNLMGKLVATNVKERS